MDACLLEAPNSFAWWLACARNYLTTIEAWPPSWPGQHLRVGGPRQPWVPGAIWASTAAAGVALEFVEATSCMLLVGPLAASMPRPAQHAGGNAPAARSWLNPRYVFFNRFCGGAEQPHWPTPPRWRWPKHPAREFNPSSSVVVWAWVNPPDGRRSAISPRRDRSRRPVFYVSTEFRSPTT